jgi:hypothetical protein
LAVTAPKCNAESEQDPTNSVNFPEDKILLLLLACDRRRMDVLDYLVNDLSKFWSSKAFDQILKQASDFPNPNELFEHLYASKLAHSYFLG